MIFLNKINLKVAKNLRLDKIFNLRSSREYCDN